MAGPLIRSLWSSTRNSLSSSYNSKPAVTPLKPYLYARATGIRRAFSATPAAAAASSPGGALDPSLLRNVAVIAHVDHGKTTLMDRLLRQCGANIPHERALDSISLERERGITIASKVWTFSISNICLTHSLFSIIWENISYYLWFNYLCFAFRCNSERSVCKKVK